PPPSSRLPPLSLHDALPISPPLLCWTRGRATAPGRRPGIAERQLGIGLHPDPEWNRRPRRSSERGHVVAPRTALGTCPRSAPGRDRKSTRLNSSHVKISYAV